MITSCPRLGSRRSYHGYPPGLRRNRPSLLDVLSCLLLRVCCTCRDASIGRSGILERASRQQLHYERDLGVPIDVIDPRNYLLPRDPPQLAPADRALLDWKDEDHLSSREL